MADYQNIVDILVFTLRKINLGNPYLHPEAVTPDLTEAFPLFIKACQNPFPEGDERRHPCMARLARDVRAQTNLANLRNSTDNLHLVSNNRHTYTDYRSKAFNEL